MIIIKKTKKLILERKYSCTYECALSFNLILNLDSIKNDYQNFSDNSF